jgi:transcriptional regulator with XRE-family HTH domain
MSEFSELLKATRIAHGISVTKLSRISGYDAKSIYEYESGETAPPDEKRLGDLCEAMGATDKEARHLMQVAFNYHKEKVRLRYASWNVK